ncbi:mechanosensitive ion channel [Algiphilus sp. NNCM1]|uniref:mechanosensitive ion channel domain-containing protein n=1 Tax=Algiphilus sp. TaxID=1872431 RepID=UPI001CA6B7D1|nr:mechanosensitive ion channel domain-containing protein [Algiphilus sp.]MBY8964230.1 mechanosensitive ion channel [Algiphilus acroporae]MCI5102624.1 mechanosensitive ion channel [Algiphilus sp.]
MTRIGRSFRQFLWLSLLCMPLAVVHAQGDGKASSSEPPSAQTAEQLADLLENEATRAQLIEALRRQASTESAATESEEATEAAPVSLSRRIALSTESIAEELAAEFSRAFGAFTQAGEATAGVDWQALAAASVDLIVVVIAVIVAFMLLRRLCIPVYRRLDVWSQQPAQTSALLRKTVAVLLAAGVDTVLIVLSWVIGFLLAIYALSDPGAMDTRQTMFLNAFLMIEIFKALIRTLFATRYEGLRLLPMSAENAAYWNRWFARISGFIGYGLLVAVPIANINISPDAGRALTFIVMGLAFLYALMVISQNKEQVRGRLEVQAKQAHSTFARVGVYVLARVWHALAIAYFAAMAVVAILQPEETLPFMLKATLQTLLAVGGGVFLAVVLAQIISRRIRLPEDTSRRFPQLEERLNAAIPGVLQVLRAIILIVVALLVLDAWRLFNLPEWIGSEAGTTALAAAISIALILLVAKGIWIAFASWIELRLNPDNDRGGASAREQTLLALFRSAFLIVLVVMTAMIVLSELGINIGPLIAGAGVLGLAIGFGAQKLVQDVITGVFIQLENAINTGEVVTAGAITGTAEKITVRSVGIRDLSGTYHVVPFSSVDTVSNFMRDFAYHVGVYGVAYREDISAVIEQLQAAYSALVADPNFAEKVLEPLEVHGVTELADSAVNVRIRIKTLPGSQWGVGREYNRLVKQHFDAAGIEIPFPHTTLYFGEDRAGYAPPANVRVLEGRDRRAPLPAEPADANTPLPDAANRPSERSDFDESQS